MIFPILILKKCKTQLPINQMVRKNGGGGVNFLQKKLHMSKKCCNFALE